MQGRSFSELAEIDIREVDKDALIDISSMTFDIEIPLSQRAGTILDNIKNPYCFRVGKIAVQVEFAENGPRLHDCLLNVLHR